MSFSSQWCSEHSRCKKKLNDLLATPWQRCSKLGLLLKTIMKYTSLDSDKEILKQAIEDVESSLRKCFSNDMNFHHVFNRELFKLQCIDY